MGVGARHGTARHGTCRYTSTSLGAHCSRPFHLRTNACLAEWRALESTAAAVWRGARLSSVRSRPHFCQLPVGDGVLPNVSKSEKLTVEATRSHGEGATVRGERERKQWRREGTSGARKQQHHATTRWLEEGGLQ